MSIIVDKISDDIMELPKPERAKLAHLLILSLDSERELIRRRQWLEEINKRSIDIVEGRVNCRLIDEILTSIRQKLNDARLQSS
jgi:hypothetical protein